ncbi:MAG: hypothetical protein NC041_04580 [Bacteroides sp.]|nr:hypothetical protein [Prevotella sp.]MCM1407235.1 hypothetical protein [Treponema brennaborense]MCM1469723.1 hypothetical protein [Bacteroides sp.]
MKPIRYMLFVCAAIFLPHSASADAVTIFVHQKNGIAGNICEETLIFEDAVMDYFFNRGAIVSNVPVSTEKDVYATYNAAFDASVNGYIDYLIMFTVHIEAETERIKTADWQLVRIANAETVDSGRLDAPRRIFAEKETDPADVRRFASACADASAKKLALW